MDTLGTNSAGRKMASLEVHISHFSRMWQQVRHPIDSGCRNFVTRLQDFHNLHLNCRSVCRLQEGNRQGRQGWTASPRLYGNTRRRFEIGVAPVAITTLHAPPPLTAVGANLHLHDRRPPMMSTTNLGFDHLIPQFFPLSRAFFCFPNSNISSLLSFRLQMAQDRLDLTREPS